MLMRRLLMCSLLMVVAACAAPPAEPQIDFAAEEQAIRDIATRWLAMEKARDAAGIAALFADDGRLQWNGSEPIVGPAAIQAFLEGEYADDPDVVPDWGTERVLIASSGDLAVEFGYWRNTGGKDGDDNGKYVTVFRKANGEWKVDTDTSMSVKPRQEPDGGAE